MGRLLKTNFNTGKIVNPFDSLQTGMNNFSEIMNQQQEWKDKDAAREIAAEQQALQNRMAQERLDIAKAGEARNVSDYQFKQDKLKAMQEAAALQTNIESGQAGQDRFETAMQAALPNLETKEQQAFDYYAKSDAISKLPESQRIAATKALQEKYLALGDAKTNAARDKYFEQEGIGYEAAHRASDYDGLRYNKADAGYEDRVYKNLMASGKMTPAEATAQAKIQASQYGTEPLSKAQQDSRKAEFKIVENTLKNQLDISKTVAAQGKASGGGTSYSTSGKYGGDTIDKAIDSKGFSDSWISFGSDKQKVKDGMNKILSTYKREGLKESDVTDAMYMIAEGRAGATWSWDPSIDLPTLEKKALEIANTRKAMGGSYNASTYKKYGPSYLKNASTAMTKAKNARQAIMNKYQGIDKGDTGLAALEATYDNFSKAPRKPNGFDSNTLIGAAMNSPKAGEVLRAAINDNDRFMKEYKNLGKGSKAQKAVDRVLNNSVGTEQPLQDKIVTDLKTKKTDVIAKNPKLYSPNAVSNITHTAFKELSAEEQLLHYNAYRTANPKGVLWDTATEGSSSRSATGERTGTGGFDKKGYIQFMEKTMKANNSISKALTSISTDAHEQYKERHPTYDRKREQLQEKLAFMATSKDRTGVPQVAKDNIAAAMVPLQNELNSLNAIEADMNGIDTRIKMLRQTVSNPVSDGNARNAAIKEISRLTGLRNRFGGPQGSYEFTSPREERRATSEQQKRLAQQNETFEQVGTVAGVAGAISKIGRAIFKKATRINDPKKLLEYYSDRKVTTNTTKGIPSGPTIITPSKSELITGLKKALADATSSNDITLMRELNRQLALLK